MLPRMGAKWSRADIETDPDRPTTFRRPMAAREEDPSLGEFLSIKEFYEARDTKWAAKISETQTKRWAKYRAAKDLEADSAKRQRELADMVKGGTLAAPDLKNLVVVVDSTISTLMARLLSGDIEPKNVKEAAEVIKLSLEVKKAFASAAATVAAPTGEAEAGAAKEDMLAHLRQRKEQAG